MPATTVKGYPYPTGDDPVTQGDDTIKALADAVNDRIRSGSATVTIPNNVRYATVAITFPVGLYTRPPNVQVTVHSVNYFGCINGNATVTGATIGAARQDALATGGPVTVDWTAFPT